MAAFDDPIIEVTELSKRKYFLQLAHTYQRFLISVTIVPSLELFTA